MHTVSAARRSGVGRAILWHIIAAARALYASAGFLECPPFGDYRDDPNSVFMTLDIGA
jgi:putative acetyltransferase